MNPILEYIRKVRVEPRYHKEVIFLHKWHTQIVEIIKNFTFYLQQLVEGKDSLPLICYGKAQ